MAEETPQVQATVPYADVPPRLIYEAVFTARNAEIAMLDSNTRYFYLGQTALIGYMIFEFKSHLQQPVSIYFLLSIWAICCFALSFHAVYSEGRMSGSFRLMALCEDTCGHYERHGFVNSTLFFYAKAEVREMEESRKFAAVQVGFVTLAANFWLYCAFALIFAIGCVAVFQFLTRYYQIKEIL